MGPGGPGGAPPAGIPGATTVAAAPVGATSKQGIYLKHAGGTSGYDQALAVFEANIAKNPGDSLALYGKAWIQAERQQKTEAVTTFNSFLKVSKDSSKNQEARKALARLK